jgi:tetratricopeptide (TPR) repeat protein
MRQPPHIFRLSIHATVPPPTDPRMVLQRADEVNSVLRMLSDAQISTVVLTGDPGAGKSTLAALLYRRLEAAVQAGQAPIRHFVWLGLGPNATLPDVIAAVLGSIDMIGSDYFIRKPEEQISLLEQALRRPQESTFVVLDQFEELLDTESSRGLVGRGAIALFLDLLQRDLGDSRVVLTCSRSPYDAQNGENMRVRTNLVSRISLPEGVALLQQRGVQGTPEELSLIWQRCAGHVFGLVQFATLCTLSGFSLSYLLNSPDYVPVWNGEVTLNLIGAVYSFLNPIQRTLLRSLCLYNEPVPVEGVMIAITGEEDATALDATAFERELGVLTWFALVQHFSEENSKSSFFLHSLLRQYVMEHYLEGSERHPSGGLSIALGVTTEPNPMLVNQEAREVALAAGHIRVAMYYARLAQQYCPPHQNRSGPQDVEPLLAMAHHLCRGWHWQQAYDLLCYEGLNESMMQWGAWNTLIQLYTAMVPPPGMVARRDEGQIFSHLGLLYGRLGDYQQSRFYYEQALTTQREIGDQQGVAVTLTNQGELLRSLGETQQARANFEQALMLNRQEYDAQLESVLLHNLGLLYQNEKDYQQALHYYQQSLKLAQNLQERASTGMILTNIGMLLYEQGRLQEALALLFSALEIRLSSQDRTVASLVRFLQALEQRVGRDAFIHLRREAMGMWEEVMARVGMSGVGG